MTADTQVPANARAVVVTVSDRSHSGVREDSSGPLLAAALREMGFAVGDVVVVPDEVDAVVEALQEAVNDGVDCVVTTGGTGLSPRDITPEATRLVIEREAPGIAETLRQDNRDAVPTAILSRGVSGVIDSTLIVNLPGSTGGVRDGIAVLRPVLGHAVAMLRGGDH